MRRWYYVSYYEEYPIYEAAEGGYYYAGNELTRYIRYGSLNRARRAMKRIVEDGDYDVIGKNGAYRTSRYIGCGQSVRIETVLGVHEQGYKIYQ